MDGWRRVGILASFLTVAGCSSPPVATAPEVHAPSEEPFVPAPPSEPESPLDSDPPPPENEGGGRPVPGDSPQALHCAPVEGGNAGIPVPGEGGRPPSLPLPSCVPCDETPPSHEAPACEVTNSNTYEVERRQYDAQGTLRDYRRWQPVGVLTLQRRYDAAGQLLEEQTWDPQGNPGTLVKNTWVDGLLLRSEHTRANSSLRSKQEWTYDDQRQVVRRVDWFASTQPWRVDATHQYVRGAAGRLERIEHQYAWEDTVHLSEYHYDAAGLLTRIESQQDCDDDLHRCETYAYDEAGHKRAFSQYSTSGRGYEETYDAQGRVLTTSLTLHQVEPTEQKSEQQYDALGRLRTRRLSFMGYMMGSTSLIRYLHGDQNQLLLEWWETQGYHSSAPDRFRTIRSTFLCGTALPYLKETDENGDGVVDARCTYERDGAGRLVREQCGALDTPDAFTSRTEYRYDCTP